MKFASDRNFYDGSFKFSNCMPCVKFKILNVSLFFVKVCENM